MLLQPYKALGMLSFIEKAQFSKSSSPDKEEPGRDNKETAADSDTWRASISQVVCSPVCCQYVYFSMVHNVCYYTLSPLPVAS